MTKHRILTMLALTSVATWLLGCGGSTGNDRTPSALTGGAGVAAGGANTCPVGSETCACYGNETCDVGLICASHLCVRLTATGGAHTVAPPPLAAGGVSYGGTSAIGPAPSNGGSFGLGGFSGSVAVGGFTIVLGTGGSSAQIGIGGADVMLPPACGDGVVNQDREMCDDGNALAGDGCNGICNVEPNYRCPRVGGKCELSFVCGDGVVNPGEECDQGKYQGSPGCSLDCKQRGVGYLCIPGQQCVVMFSCGDGRIQQGESCDPPSVGKGCSASCQAEPGYRCKPGSCAKIPFCGDGVVQPASGEKCDQGTYQGSPGCSDDCRVRDGLCTCSPGAKCVCLAPKCDASACTYGGSCPDECGPAPRCGDGIVQIDYGEECDDGVNDGSYGKCKDNCQRAPWCGDGIVNGDALHPEICDDGINDGTYNGCGVNCVYPPRCGDGIVQEDWAEQCEPQSPSDPLCTLQCKQTGSCGDGVIDSALAEECDYGSAFNIGAYGGCNANCTRAAYCGDGVTNGSEQCDYGTGFSFGEYGGCNANCSWAPHCGDGIVNGPEECDLGTEFNVGDFGGCTAACTLGPHCGDGIVQSPPEECDDGSQNGSVQSTCSKACQRLRVAH